MAAFLVDHQTRFPVSYFPFEPRSRTGCVWTGLRCTAREKVRVDGSKKRRASKFFPLGAYSPQPRNEEKQTRSTRCLSVEERKLRGTRAAAVWPGEFFALLESGVLSLSFFFFLSFSKERDRRDAREFYEASHPDSDFDGYKVIQSWKFDARLGEGNWFLWTFRSWNFRKRKL